MNWYVLVDGRLAFIGRYQDWEAAHYVADDTFRTMGWTWLASQDDVDQWVQCATEVERGEATA